MAEIKIFLASSNELKDDRNQFEIFIRQKNDVWKTEGKPYLNLEIWEEVSEAMSATGRSQEEYNRIIRTVDIFVMLFWTKVGKYTHEEFNLAKQLFQTTGKPQVIVYQKLAQAEKQEQSLKNFINSLISNPEDEYFCGQYEIFDTLQLKFEKELNHYYKKYFSPKIPTKMLDTTLFTGLLATYQSGALDFLKDVGLDIAKEVGKETLKNLGSKVVNYFKGKKEEDTLDALEIAVNKQDVEKFKAKSESVLELLKTAVENDVDFRKEVEDILNGLDENTQKALYKQATVVVQNSKNVVAGVAIGSIGGDFIVGDGHSAKPKKD